MTDTELLSNKIKESGYKLDFVAKTIGITRETLRRKINNIYLFDSAEISGLRNLLGLSLEEVDKIFFTLSVDKTSTKEQ